jgi:hypothetical protein
MTHASLAPRLAAGTLALALCAPAATAETHMSGSAYQAAQDLVSRLQEERQTAFEGGEYVSLASWMADNAMDRSDFHFSGEMVLSDGPATTYALSVSGDELAQLAASAMMGAQGVPGDLIEEYELNVVVNAAWDVPGDVSGAEIAFYESGTFGTREGIALPEGPFSSSTVCTMHLGGADQGEIMTASCTTTSLL